MAIVDCSHEAIHVAIDLERIDLNDWNRAEKKALILLGGEIAQKVHQPEVQVCGNESDREELKDLAARLNPDSEEQAFAWVKRMQEAAATIVHERCASRGMHWQRSHMNWLCGANCPVKRLRAS